jgi:hypothetical protein
MTLPQIVNIANPTEQGTRVVGFKIQEGDEAWGVYGLSEPLVWFEALLNAGIKNHDGQKLLLKYILDNDSGISENSREILKAMLK